MDAHHPAEAVEILDLLLKFFGGGERWIKGRFSDRRGNCCLVVALDFVSGHYAAGGEAAERYLAGAISDQRDQRLHCPKDGADYARLRAALRRAVRGEWYQASKAVLRRDSLSDFNDGCKDFAELRTLIEQARARAINDARPGLARLCPGVGSGELVMAYKGMLRRMSQRPGEPRFSTVSVPRPRIKTGNSLPTSRPNTAQFRQKLRGSPTTDGEWTVYWRSYKKTGRWLPQWSGLPSQKEKQLQ